MKFNRSEYVKGIFDYLGWTYEQFRENCSRCGKSLAYHGMNSDLTACVSCPYCDAIGVKNKVKGACKTFSLPLLPGDTELVEERKSRRKEKGEPIYNGRKGRPPLNLSLAEKKERLKEQKRQFRRKYYAENKK